MEIKTEIENIKECLAGYMPIGSSKRGVYAQAYAAIEFLENELETLREKYTTIDASNGIKQGNIELLEAENAKLIAELKEAAFTLCALRAEIDEYQAQQIPEEAIKMLNRIAGNWSLDYRADAEEVLSLLSASQPKGDK